MKIKEVGFDNKQYCENSSINHVVHRIRYRINWEAPLQI
jgi:hypothetical protein